MILKKLTIVGVPSGTHPRSAVICVSCRDGVTSKERVNPLCIEWLPFPYRFEPIQLPLRWLFGCDNPNIGRQSHE